MSDNAAPTAGTASALSDNTNPTSENSADNADSASGGEAQKVAAAAAAIKDGASDASKMYKVKIDGQEVDLSESELKKYASLGKSAHKRMEEAAMTRKENEALKGDIAKFFELLKTDPLAILKDEQLGLDLRKIAELVMNEEIEKSKKTPEQQEIEKLQKALADKEKKEKESDEARKKAEWEKLQNDAASSIERDILEALQSKELPNSPYVINRMVSMMYLAAQNKVNLSAKEIMPIVKKQIMDDFKSLSGLLPEEQLESILGDDKVKALRKRYIQRVKKVSNASDIKSAGGDVKNAADKSGGKPKEKVAARDFFKKLGSF